MKKLIIPAIFILMILYTFIGCSDPESAIKTLQASGYTNIVITGSRPFSKGNDDFYSTGFKANSINGTLVSGTVTKGFIKGSTIRLD